VNAANAGRAVMRRARVTNHEFVQSNECEGPHRAMSSDVVRTDEARATRTLFGSEDAIWFSSSDRLEDDALDGARVENGNPGVFAWHRVCIVSGSITAKKLAYVRKRMAGIERQIEYVARTKW
jgi:hypothetical protein